MKQRKQKEIKELAPDHIAKKYESPGNLSSKLNIELLHYFLWLDIQKPVRRGLQNTRRAREGLCRCHKDLI